MERCGKSSNASNIAVSGQRPIELPSVEEYIADSVVGLGRIAPQRALAFEMRAMARKTRKTGRKASLFGSWRALFPCHHSGSNLRDRRSADPDRGAPGFPARCLIRFIEAKRAY